MNGWTLNIHKSNLIIHQGTRVLMLWPLFNSVAESCCARLWSSHWASLGPAGVCRIEWYEMTTSVFLTQELCSITQWKLVHPWHLLIRCGEDPNNRTKMDAAVPWLIVPDPGLPLEWEKEWQPDVDSHPQQLGSYKQIMPWKFGKFEGHCGQHDWNYNEEMGNIHRFLEGRTAGKTTINHPFGNSLYHLSVVIWEMVYYCFTNIMECVVLEEFFLLRWKILEHAHWAAS